MSRTTEAVGYIDHTAVVQMVFARDPSVPKRTIGIPLEVFDHLGDHVRQFRDVRQFGSWLGSSNTVLIWMLILRIPTSLVRQRMPLPVQRPGIALPTPLPVEPPIATQPKRKKVTAHE